MLAGGSAGLLAGLLANARTTADCDVIWTDSTEWELMERSAREIAAEQGLPDRWLNRDCAVYAWSLPLGWLDRCEKVRTFGAFEVMRLARIALIASKVFGAPLRPQDMQDLRAIAPTASELDVVEAHLDRLASEHLDGDEFASQREVLRTLRSRP